MNTQFPVAPVGFSQQFFNLLLQQLRGYFTRVVSHDEETPHIILRSPNGSRYTVSVSDTGTLDIALTGKPP